MPDMFPTMGWTFIMPDILIDSKQFRRVHGRIAKQAVRDTLSHHWEKVLPLHFKPGAHSRYNYKRRGFRYRQAKKARYRSVADLVKTGRTRLMMTTNRPHIAVGGTASTLLRGTYKMKFPFPIGDSKKKGVRVKPADMVKEVSSWTMSEIGDAAKLYKKRYGHHLGRELRRRPKWRKTIKAKKA